MTLIDVLFYSVLFVLNYVTIHFLGSSHSQMVESILAIVACFIEVFFIRDILPFKVFIKAGLPIKWIFYAIFPQLNKSKKFPKQPQECLVFLVLLNATKWKRLANFKAHFTFEPILNETFLYVLQHFLNVLNTSYTKNEQFFYYYLNAISQLHFFVDLSKIAPQDMMLFRYKLINLVSSNKETIKNIVNKPLFKDITVDEWYYLTAILLIDMLNKKVFKLEDELHNLNQQAAFCDVLELVQLYTSSAMEYEPDRIFFDIILLKKVKLALMNKLNIHVYFKTLCVRELVSSKIVWYVHAGSTEAIQHQHFRLCDYGIIPAGWVESVPPEALDSTKEYIINDMYVIGTSSNGNLFEYKDIRYADYT